MWRWGAHTTRTLHCSKHPLKNPTFDQPREDLVSKTPSNAIIEGWRCNCCLDKCCCCCFQICNLDHLHCHTYKPTVQRHSAPNAFKWVKSKKGNKESWIPNKSAAPLPSSCTKKPSPLKPPQWIGKHPAADTLDDVEIDTQFWNSAFTTS